MKKFFAFLTLIMIFSLSLPAVSYSVSDCKISININQENLVHETILMVIHNTGNTSITSDTYSVSAKTFNESVTSEGRPLKFSVKEEEGASLFTWEYDKPIHPGETRELTISFSTDELVGEIAGKSIFTLTYTASVPIQNFRFIVALPEGSGLAAVQYPETGTSIPAVSPPYSRLYSDGRRILVEWSEKNLSPNEKFSVVLTYEELAAPLPSKPSPKFIGLIVALAVVVALGTYLLTKQRMTEKAVEMTMMVLTEDEEKVVQAIADAEGETTQDTLPKTTGFSKAKISQLVSRLEKKGILQKEPYRKTNKLILRKELRKK